METPEQSAQPQAPKAPETKPPESPLAQIRLVDDFRAFTETDRFLHTSKGDVDLSDRHQRWMAEG
jgi:hypothetical protein